MVGKPQIFGAFLLSNIQYWHSWRYRSPDHRQIAGVFFFYYCCDCAHRQPHYLTPFSPSPAPSPILRLSGCLRDLSLRSPKKSLLPTLLAAMLAPPSDASGIQIRTLREHEANNVLSMEVGGCGMFRRPWRASAGAYNNKPQQERQQQTSENDVDQQRSSPWSASMVCNTAFSSAKRPFFDAAAANTTTTTTATASCSARVELPRLACRQPETHVSAGDETRNDSSVYSSNADTSTSTVASTATAVVAATTGSTTTSTADDGIYDPEALLLEPLLNSPRSERENRGRGGREDSGGNHSNIICESVLQNGRIMSQSIGSNQGPVSVGVRWDRDVESGSSAMLSSTMPPSGVLSRPLVPVSPALSGVQGSSVPSFIPRCDQTSRVVQQAVGGGGGVVSASSSGSGAGGWYLNFPPNQHQHNHNQQGASSVSSSAANLVAAAANVAAAIRQVTAPFSHSGQYPPSLKDHSGVAIAAGVKTGKNDNGNNDTGACDTPGGYSSCLKQHPNTSWSTALGGAGRPQQGDVLGRSRNSGDSGNNHQRPRFVTREECVPASRQPRCGSMGSSSNLAAGDAEWLAPCGLIEGGRTGQSNNVHLQHLGSNESPYPRSAENEIVAAGEAASQQRWHQSSGGATTGVKRLYSQSAARISSGAYTVTKGSSSSSPPASRGAGHTPPMAARLPPMMLAASSGGVGTAGKRMKLVGAADGCQKWANVPPRGSSDACASVIHDNTSTGWRSGINTTGGDIVGNSANSTAAIASEESLCASSSAMASSIVPRRRSTRSVTGISEATAATAAARAALAAACPRITIKHHGETTEEDEDSAGGGGGSGSGGDSSSPDWAERDESEEEALGKAGGGTCSGGGGKNNKVPFMLDPKLWVIVERRAICTAKQCAYRK